jgi:hypothetical protein
MFNFYRNEAHYECLVVYNTKLKAFPVVKTLVLAYVPEFEDLLDKEGKLVDAQKINPYTAQIVEADKLNDYLVRGIKDSVTVAMRHYDQTIVAAAIRLNDRMKVFGNIERKSYEEEAAAISILLVDLQGTTFAADVTKVGIDGWITQLVTSLANFKNLLQLRNESVAPTLPEIKLKDLRKQIDQVFTKMTTRINAAAELDDTGVYEQFILQLNAEILYFNEHTHRRTRKDLGEGDRTVIEAIAEQPYTGSAITPLPVVHYYEPGKEAVTLTFANDYTVTYKNNINVGMAEITIHGKSAYKGKKITTFIIAKTSSNTQNKQNE